MMNRSTKSRSYIAAPLIALNLVFFVASQIYFYRYSVLENLPHGQVGSLTLDNLTSMITDEFNRRLIIQTAEFGFIVVALCLLLAFPVAYAILRYGRMGNAILAIVVMASFASAIVRAMGMTTLLGQDGLIPSILRDIGITPPHLINNMTGAIVGTTQAVLPLMILLLYPAVDKLGVDIEDASRSLGAGWFTTLRLVLIPQLMPAFISSSLLALAVTVSSFTTPALLGGARIPLLAVAIRSEVGALNLPMAATYAITLLVLVGTLMAIAGLLGVRRRLKSA